MAPSIFPSSCVAMALVILGADLYVSAASEPSAFMSLGSSLSPTGNQLSLLSSGQKFSFGFRSVFQVDAFYVAVWYANLDNTIVWVANRDAPVTSGASLTLTISGDLELYDKAQLIWSTTNTSGQGVQSAQIQDSGSFVLLNSSGGIVWQSFDNPTDTLLPTQRMKTSAVLISRKSAASYASGIFYLKFPTSGSVQLGASSYPNPTYWSVGTTTSISVNSSFSNPPPGGELDPSGSLSFYNTSGQAYASFLPTDTQTGSLIIRRVTLDLDGNLRMYSWDDSSRSWITVWKAIFNECNLLAVNAVPICGPYGVCIYNPEPACVCPPGFRVVDYTDISQGCTASFPIDCKSSTKYVELDNTDFPFNDMPQSTAGISQTNCLQLCSADCSCVLAVYDLSGLARCWLKSKVLNGYSPQNSYGTRSFLKVSESDLSAMSSPIVSVTNWTNASFWSVSPALLTPPSVSAPAKHTHKVSQYAADIIFITVAELVCFGVALWFLHKRAASRIHQPAERMSGSTTIFSYQELETATSNFSERLGSGAFGTVYKGMLPGGRIVAVKRLEGVSQGENQFRAEIATIGKIHHMNLLRLYGFCAEGDHRLLVYEFMENGSLDGFLFNKPDGSSCRNLNWETRFAICVGTARGITYLHEECLDCILHCDIKPQNILLDKDCCPKVADFGLAYLFGRNDTLKVSTIRGTRGYLAPEWVANLPITAKADVFSFGMLMLEIVSGRSNYSFSSSGLTSEKWYFPLWAFQQMSQGKLQDILDPNVSVDADYQQVERVMKVAFLCIQQDMFMRPSMRSVVQMLEGTLPVSEPPPAPSTLFEGLNSETPH